MMLKPSREVPCSTGRVGVTGVRVGRSGVGLGWLGLNKWVGEYWGRVATSWGEDKAGWRGHLTKANACTNHTLLL